METNLLLYHIVDKHRTIFVLYLLNSPFFLAKQIESSFEKLAAYRYIKTTSYSSQGETLTLDIRGACSSGREVREECRA